MYLSVYCILNIKTLDICQAFQYQRPLWNFFERDDRHENYIYRNIGI